MTVSSHWQLGQPRYLPIHLPAGASQTITLREHVSADRCTDPALPSVLLTLHPGYAAGSYGPRDYFELLAPLLFQACWGECRLRMVTINHPGYDRPPGETINRFALEPYSLFNQPAVIIAALRVLLWHDLAAEDHVHLVTYGHSMGGLALARCDLQALESEMRQEGRQLTTRKVLSAPALALSQAAQQNMGWLTFLHTLKHTVGRVPLYGPVAKGLFKTMAPILYRRDARHYSLNPDCSFTDFCQYDPFLLLRQGRELLQLELELEELAVLLDGASLFLAIEDQMVDVDRLLRAAELARAHRLDVTVERIDAPHNAERERPQEMAERLYHVIKTWQVSERWSGQQ